MPDIRDLLQGAAPRPSGDPDLTAIKSRVTHRRRWRQGAGGALIATIAAAAVVAVALPGESLARQHVKVTSPVSAAPATTLPAPPTTVPAATQQAPATTNPIPTTTQPAPTTTVPATTPATGTPAGAVTATGHGVTMSLWSSPRSGTAGSVSIQAWATLSGSVPAGTLFFFVGSGPANQGQAASSEQVMVSGPGTYAMPQPYRPDLADEYGVSADFWGAAAGTSLVIIGGLPATSGRPYPYPSLVTNVTPAPDPVLPGAPPCEDLVPADDHAQIRPSLIFIGCATSNEDLTAITWTSWSASGATGTATQGINNCEPSCASGTYTTYPVTVALSNPSTVGGFLVFTTITTTPTSSGGQSLTATAPGWGWVGNN